MNNILNRIAKADELKSVEALQTAINNGTIPGYIGVPMIAELVKNQKEAMALAAGAPQRTVTDQVMQEARGIAMPQMAASDRPPIPQQIPPQNPMPIREQVAGIDAAQSNLPTQNMAGGGIVAFAGGDLVDDSYDPTEDEDYEEYYADMEHDAELARILANQEASSSALTEAILDNPRVYAGAAGAVAGNAGTGIKYKEPIPTSGIKADQYSGDKDQARKYNVGNLRPSGFTYKGQVGVSPGGFAMFDSREAGIAALNQDINAKLNRGLDTPTKFISVYAPASDKNDVGAYSANVARALGIGPNDKIPNTPEARQLLANAITRQEGAQYATARFAKGGSVGDVKHYVLGDLVMSDFGEGVGPDPRSPAAVDEFGRDPKKVLAEKAKSAEAEKYLKDAAARNARVRPMGPPAPAQIRPVGIAEAPPTWFQKLYGRASMPKAIGTGTVLPGLIAEGGYELGTRAMNTMAGNPYFEDYSDPFMGDLAVGNAILNQNQGALAKAREVKPPAHEEYDDLTKQAVKDATKIKKDVIAEQRKDLNSGDSIPDAQAKAEQTMFDEMQAAIKKRSAALEDEKSIDNYLAVLQGFLGMMGGTSPYAMVNIGQGASSGINTLLAARKQTGLAERALGKDQMSLFTNKMAADRYAQDRAQREKIAMLGLDEKWADNYAAVEAKRAEALRKSLNDSPMLKGAYDVARRKVEKAYAEGKTPDPKDVLEFNNAKAAIKELEDNINKSMPLPIRPGIAGAIPRPAPIKLD